MRRLAVYREVFDFFIDEFKTYQSILSDIKNEYESRIFFLQSELNELLPLKSQLQFIRLENIQEMDRFSRDSESIIEKLKDTNIKIRKELKQTKSDLETFRKENLILKENANDSIVTYDRPNQEHAKALADLYSEMEKMDNQFKESLLSKESEIIYLNSELNELNKKMQNLEREHELSLLHQQTLISPQDYQKAQDQIKDTQKNMSTKELEIIQLNETIRTLEKEKQEIKDNIKPREVLDKFPNWGWIQDQVPFAIDEFYNLCKSLNYNECIMTLIREVQKIKNSGERLEEKKKASKTPTQIVLTTTTSPLLPDTFEGLGTWDSIPKFLRYKGSIKNHYLTKSQLIQIVRELWNAKESQQNAPSRNKKKQQNTKLSLEDVIHLYLKKKFGTSELIAEWAYNIYYGLKFHSSSNGLLALFFGIIEGQIQEETWNQIQDKVNTVQMRWLDFDSKLHDGLHLGSIPFNEGFSILKQDWKYKNIKEISALYGALEADVSNAQIIQYEWIFENENDLSFLNCLRMQELSYNKHD